MPVDSSRSSEFSQPEAESWREKVGASGRPVMRDNHESQSAREERLSREGIVVAGGREAARVEDRATRAWDDVVFTDKVMRFWLDGESISTIMEKVDSTYHLVLKALTQRRTELRELQDVDMLEMAAERIEAFRDIKRRAVKGIEMRPGQAPQLLTVALRAEENIGRIQGVLNDKVIHLGRIEHVAKKLYDFEDEFPDQGQSKANQPTIIIEPRQD